MTSRPVRGSRPKGWVRGHAAPPWHSTHATRRRRHGAQSGPCGPPSRAVNAAGSPYPARCTASKQVRPTSHTSQSTQCFMTSGMQSSCSKAITACVTIKRRAGCRVGPWRLRRGPIRGLEKGAGQERRHRQRPGLLEGREALRGPARPRTLEGLRRRGGGYPAVAAPRDREAGVTAGVRARTADDDAEDPVGALETVAVERAGDARDGQVDGQGPEAAEDGAGSRG